MSQPEARHENVWATAEGRYRWADNVDRVGSVRSTPCGVDALDSRLQVCGKCVRSTPCGVDAFDSRM